MSVTSGFFNSIAEDRKYNATQISRIFDGIILDGVFGSIGDAFMVRANAGMVVAVGEGRAWFNHTWTLNDADILLTVPDAHAILSRIDTVVLEVNADDTVRANSIFIRAGDAATNPVPVALTNTETIHQYPLAYISVPFQTNTILPGFITNVVGTAACPFVTGPLSMVTTDELLVQWQNQFGVWFDAVKGQLSTDPAGNLQNQMFSHNHSAPLFSKIVTAGLADGILTADAAGRAKMADGFITLSKLLGNGDFGMALLGNNTYGYPIPMAHGHPGADITTPVSNALAAPWGGLTGKPMTQSYATNWAGITGSFADIARINYIYLFENWVLLAANMSTVAGVSGNGFSYCEFPPNLKAYNYMGALLWLKGGAARDFIGVGGVSQNYMYMPQIEWNIPAGGTLVMLGLYYFGG
jgi:hypothetical protein